MGRASPLIALQKRALIVVSYSMVKVFEREIAKQLKVSKTAVHKAIISSRSKAFSRIGIGQGVQELQGEGMTVVGR